MRRRMRISEARGKLPELVKHLDQHPDDVVLIEHRDLDQRIAMTTESHLRYLETVVAEMRKQARGKFRLAGSIKSALSDDELESALKSLRTEVARETEKKIRRLAEALTD